MGLAQIQSAIARLSIDAVLRNRFYSDPVTVAPEIGLSGDEALTLAINPRRQLDQFADSLRGKRRDQVRRSLPITSRALGPKFDIAFRRYLDHSPPRGSRADVDDVSAFVSALCQSANAVTPEWTIDLARYELAWRQATRPSFLPIVRVFRYPISQLIAENQPIPDKPRKSIAFWWKPNHHARVRHNLITSPIVF